jgi:impB/mucB/samB family C-terminal domain
MLAAKSFGATSAASDIRRWLGILATELAARMEDDEAQNQRRPRTLVLHYRWPALSRRHRRKDGRTGKIGLFWRNWALLAPVRRFRQRNAK